MFVLISIIKNHFLWLWQQYVLYTLFICILVVYKYNSANFVLIVLYFRYLFRNQDKGGSDWVTNSLNLKKWIWEHVGKPHSDMLHLMLARCKQILFAKALPKSNVLARW